MATYNANISVKVAGLTQLKNLENRVSQLQDRFTKLNAAAARVTAPFQGHIKALTEINKLLKDNNALLNQQARVASSVSRGSGSSSGAVKDARVQKEITEQLQRQVTLLRDRARATAPAGDAMQKLLRAQLELNNGAEGNIRLVRQLIRNARELVKADEDRLKVSREVKTATEQRVDEAKELLAVERQIGQMLNETKRKTAEIAREDAKRAKARKEMIGGAVGRVDRAFGGGISGALNGVANAGIRAGAVGGLLAGSQLMGAAQSMPVIGKAVSALQGPLIEAIRLLGDFAGHWGLAAVAAAAFAPLLPKIGQAAIQAMPGIGSLGKAIADVTGLSERAQPAINGLKKSWDTLVSSNPATSLFGLGANSMQLTGGQAPELMNGAAKFQSTMGLDMVEKIAQGIYQQIQASADAMEANRQKAKSWADALEEGRNWIKESVAKTRELEQAMSEAARQRLAASAANNPRVRAGAAMVNTGFREYGPGGNSMTAQSQYRGMLNAQAKLDNETRYSWVQFLRQGQALQRELVVLSKQEAAEAAKATDEAREALMIKQREIDFENRLGRVREKNAAIAARDNATKQRNYGIRTGIGAGLSLANIPGQAIAQSISIGASVGGAAGGIAGGITASVVALGQLAVKSAEVGAQSEMLQNRLKLLSNGLDDYAKVAQTATTIGDKFGLSQNEAAEAFANTYARLRPMGATLEEVKTVFEGFNTAMRLAGASTAEAEGAYTQLLQGLGSGVLRGQELNSILEQAPLLAKAIADEMDTNVGQLREFGKEGELSSDVVLRALKRVADEGASRLADSLDNPIQKTKDLQNAWQKFQIAISPILTDIGAKIQDFVAAALTELTKLVNKLGEVGQQIENAVAGDTLKNAQSQFRTDSARLKELYQVPTEQRTEEQVRLITALERLQKGRLAVINAAAGKPTSTAPGLANQTDPDKDAKDKKEKEKALYDYTAQNQAALAENQLALNRQVFENEMALSEQAYRQKLDYENKLAQLKGAQLTGAGARGIFDQTAQFRQQQQEYENQRGELENQIKQARLAVQEAQAGVGIAGLSAATTRTNGGGIGQPIEYLTGDRRSSGYRADHGGNNYHEHIAYQTAKEARAAAELLNRNGIKTTELAGVNSVGRHSPNSHHYSGRAFDVPGAQVPVGQEPALSARVRQILGIGGGGVGNQAIAPGGQANMGGIIGAQGDVATAQADLAGLEQRYASLLKAQEQMKALDMPTLIAQTTQAYRDQTLDLQNQVEALQVRHGLEMEGVAPELIEGELSKLQIKQQLTQFEEGLNEAVKANNITQDQANQLLENYTQAAQGAAAAVDQLTQANIAANDPINKLVGQWKNDLGDTRGQIASLAQTVQSELGSAMSNAITGVIDGTTTVQEAFSQMFKNIGAAFISMATEMIAKALVMKALGILTGGLGGGGGFGVGGDSFGGGAFGSSFNPLNTGGSLTGGAFASGGFVTGPTNALIGEGGSNEYVIPENKMGAAMQRWNSGVRGESVVSGADPTAIQAGPRQKEELPEVKVEGGVFVYDDTRYIRADQLPSIVDQSARAGEQRALRKLQMSPATRRRVGV